MKEIKKFKKFVLMVFMLLVAFAKSNDVKAAEKLSVDKVITGEENFQLRIDKNDYVCKFQPRITGEYEFTFNTVFYNETDKAGVNDGKAEIYGVIYDEDFEEISTFCIDEEYTYYLLAFKGKSYYFAYKTSEGLYDITTNIDLIKIDIESYKFRVSCHGNPARDLNDLDNVKFDEKNMVLELNNYSGSGFVFGVGFSNRSSIVYGPEKKRKYYLYSLKDYLSNRTIKVVVNGKNKFVGDHYDKYMFGAVGGLSLEFVGNGILEKRDPVTSNGLTYTNYDMVCLDGSITVDGPTIDITSIEVDESFNMKSGKVIVYEGIDAKNANFTGGKIVAITDNNRFKGFIDVTSKIVFDGTDFELAPKAGSDRWLQPDTIFEAKEIIIKKGNIRLKLIPIYYILIGDNGEKQGLDYCGFSDVFICETLSISGGNLMIEYDKFRNESNITEDTFNKGRGNCIFNVSKELNIKNFNLVIIAEDTILNSLSEELPVGNKSFMKFGIFRKYDNDTKKNIDKNTFRIIKTSSYDISTYGIKLKNTKYYYDGKLIYPEIDYRGFVIDDYVDVKYENNLKPGVGRVIITAKTKFTGTVVLNFDILGHKKGTVLTDGKLIYKVTKTAAVGVAGKVSVIGVKKKSLKKINTKSTVKFDGIKYDVVSIGKKAFKNSKKLKSVVIGKNVSKIGKGAFARCKKLKSIRIKSNKIKKFVKGTFKGLKKSCVVKVPKKKKKVYTKKIKKAGFTGIVK